jgi:hypothetical protein
MVRGARGRFASRYTPRYTSRQRRHNRKRAKKHYRAVRTIPRGHLIGGLVRLNPRTGRYEMMPNAIVANPRRRRRRRRNPSAYSVNPRRRRRRRNPRRGTVSNRRRRRRRNPSSYASNPRFSIKGVMGTAKRAVFPAAAGIGGGVIAGLIDTKVAPKKRVMQGLLKFGAGVLGAIALRKNPWAAGAFIGSTVGTIGYGIGIRMGGGVIADSKGQALLAIADLAAEDPQLEQYIADAGSIADLVEAGELADAGVDIADSDDDVSDLVMAD